MQCGPTSLTTQPTEELTLRPLAQRYGDRQVILIYSMTCDWILVCSMSQMLVFLLIAICKTVARENEKHYSANPQRNLTGMYIHVVTFGLKTSLLACIA